MKNIIKCEDGRNRCKWSGASPDYIKYHDKEWGFPVKDDTRLFEKICLEGFQSGLSWRTILTKRENFRKAFKNFDFNKVSRFTKKDVTRLLKDEGIVRHRGKIEATINNAKMAKLLVKEFGSLAHYFWSYELDPKEYAKKPQTVPTTKASTALSKDLKARGWKFVGPTTAYAFMQAMGLVNDHDIGCVTRAKTTSARSKFTKPRL